MIMWIFLSEDDGGAAGMTKNLRLDEMLFQSEFLNIGCLYVVWMGFDSISVIIFKLTHAEL